MSSFSKLLLLLLRICAFIETVKHKPLTFTAVLADKWTQIS